MSKAHPAEFSRWAKSLAAGSTFHESLSVAEKERASPRVVEALKAASPGAILADGQWAGDLAPSAGEMAVAFVESVRPRSIFYSMAPLAIPAPFHARAIAAALIPTEDTAENTWISVKSSSIDPFTLSPVSTGAIIVVSDELARSSAPEAFRALRAELEKGATLAVDKRALSIALNGITPVEATADPLADVRALLNDVSLTGGGRLLFAAAPDTANSAATVEGMGSVFPQMGPLGGSILDIPVIVSDAMAPGSLALFDAASFVANEGDVYVDRAGAGALQMKTDPTQAAAELVSLFQSNMSAVRVIARFGIRRMRDNAAALLTGIPEAWTPEGSGE